MTDKVLCLCYVDNIFLCALCAFVFHSYNQFPFLVLYPSFACLCYFVMVIIS